MYLKFFNLREFPFGVGSDERFFFRSDIHSEALANMLYAIGQRKGMVLISGEIGAGKTFLVNMLASQLGAQAKLALTFHPPASARELLRALCDCFGLPADPAADKLTLVNKLHAYLADEHRRGKLIAVVFDEAQDLGDEALEEVRLVWNWEQAGQRLVQIVLVGQPEIRQRLTQPRFEALRQRIVMSYHLGRLSRADTARYIEHRIRAAGHEGCVLRFEPATFDQIFLTTNGVPRIINTLCDNALLTAYARGLHTITPELVGQVVREMTLLAGDAGQGQPSGSLPPAGAAPLIDVPLVPAARDYPPGPPSDPPANPAPVIEVPVVPVAQELPSDQPRSKGRPRSRVQPPPDSPPPAVESHLSSEGSVELRVSSDESKNVAQDTRTSSPGSRRASLLDDLLADPSEPMARKIYQIAQQDGEAHHVSLRVLATRLLARLKNAKCQVPNAK